MNSKPNFFALRQGASTVGTGHIGPIPYIGSGSADVHHGFGANATSTANLEIPTRPVAAGLEDHEVFGDVLARDTVVRDYLRPIKRHLLAHRATEIWINKPGELVIQLETGNVTVQEPALDFAALESFAQAIAVYSPQQQTVGAKTPLLSATMPDGERIQIVLPPAVEAGMVSMSIRIPKADVIPLAKYRDSGAFSKFIWARPDNLREAMATLSPQDRRLAELLEQGNLHDFLIESILAKKNTGVTGDTGSGKTTLMMSMCQHIPHHERLITVEDVRELMLPHHSNRVHLLYSKSSQGVARITPADLIGSLMRMAPDRALLAELRSSEAWDFLKLLTTGHSGSITSWHAESCALGSERFVFMAKENPEAATLSREEIKHLYTLTIDVVIHITRKIVYDRDGHQVGYERFVDEVYFDPWAKTQARFGDRSVGAKP
uniref:P-type DNA transfer ATPase VirB11 n=1 Tax=Acidovorax sp. SUPP3334 TaxID=2920881 RepID=UPI0029529557|nr:P-type DNA transfer ATPase VirB11 [Acidovorax sp. SUPP3334]BDH38356.1 P-type DNA transfer ATPase VirB11 [Acidovorax sp. SUPP3334]